MEIWKYVLTRLFQSAIVLLGLSILIFSLARVIPGDPARVALGPAATKSQIETLRKDMHLNQPLPVQYWGWLKSVLQGDFGMSLYTRRAVSTDILTFLPATLELVIISFLFSLLTGQIIGVLAGYFQHSWFDNLSRLIAYIGVSTPMFAVAIISALFFGYIFNLLPTSGRLASGIQPPTTITGFLIIDSLIEGRPLVALSALKHLTLPALSLSLPRIAQESRITRSSIIENINKDYIMAHKAYNIPTKEILTKFLLKPSIISTVTVLGLDFAFLISNTFVVEIVFMWPGFSKYAITAMLNKDLNAIIAVVLVIGFAFAVVNLVVDIIVAFLDPRIRLGKGRK